MRPQKWRRSFGLQPFRARITRGAESGGECGAVAGLEMPAQRFEIAQVTVERREDRVAIRNTDIAPHLGRAAGDAREIAEAAARVLEKFRSVRIIRDVRDGRKRQQMREMT